MAKLLGHRQTKEAATDKLSLLTPRHIPTLPVRYARQWLLIFYICHWRSALSIECNVGENLSVASLVRFHQFRELGRRGREGFPA